MVALIDGDDAHHARCAHALETLPPQPLVTTWPCFVEAMYLLHRAAGRAAQEELWGFLEDELVRLHETSAPERRRMRELMAAYADLPMDLADASLVAAAESLGLSRIFTLDKHFHAYRIGGGASFQIVP
jgi:predicted nucleic acid-binding protein